MHKFLPIAKLFVLLSILVVILHNFGLANKALAYEPPLGQPATINWVPDDEVTFIGRNAVRSKDFLDWTLTNYQWSYTDTDTTKTPATQPQYSLRNMWVTFRNITYALLLLFIIGSAALLIITAGKNTGIFVFLRKFFFAIAFITLAFSIIQIIYQITDILQGFFLKPPITHGRIIGVQDLLNISFHYNFLGLRAFGGEYQESAFIGLLFTRLTAITYNTMSAILLIRKIILWFFIAVSPIFPLLFLYRPLNNTGKIWVGEFFRWTLYGPLFCMFLSGLVWLWNAKILLLPFNLSDAGTAAKIVYPTAINILLGGPGLSLDYTNNLNYNDTFIQYLLALLMLWCVIIFPFILLRIFLDFFFSMYEKTNPFMFLQSFNKNPLFPQGEKEKEPIQRHGVNVRPTMPEPPLPLKPQPIGAARALEIPMSQNAVTQRSTSIQSNPTSIADRQNISNVSSISSRSGVSSHTRQNISNVSTSGVTSSNASQSNIRNYISNNQSVNTKTSAYGIHNMPIPTIRDIARYDTNNVSSQNISRISSQNMSNVSSHNISSVSTISNVNSIASSRHEVQHIQETLQKIGNPKSVTNTTERATFMRIRSKLEDSKRKGDPIAASIIAAATTVNAKGVTSQKVTHAGISGSKPTGTSSIPGGGSTPSVGITPENPLFPVVNKVQSVNLDDYEAVRDTWYKNYMNMESPTEQSKEAWLKEENTKIDKAVELITSHNTQDANRGMEMVSQLLPFLLVGGFSQTEVIAYLKAKRKAGESALNSIEQKEKEEDTQVMVETKKDVEAKHMSAQEPENNLNNTPLNEGSEDLKNKLDEKEKIQS